MAETLRGRAPRELPRLRGLDADARVRAAAAWSGRARFLLPCQLVWFDEHESTQLSPGGVIEVFKAFDAHRAPTRNPLPELLDCPRCNSRLALTHDLQRTTHFSYYRCDLGSRPPDAVRAVPAGKELRAAAVRQRARSAQSARSQRPVLELRRAGRSSARYRLSVLPFAAGDSRSRRRRQSTARAHHGGDPAQDHRRRSPRRRLDDARAGHWRLARSQTAAIDAGLAGDLVAAGVAIVAALLQLTAPSRRDAEPDFFPAGARRHKIAFCLQATRSECTSA